MYCTHMVPCWCILVNLWYHIAMDKQLKARTVRLTEQDEEAIVALKAYYGITSENEVIRLALRAAVREITGNPSASPQKERLFPPPA